MWPDSIFMWIGMALDPHTQATWARGGHGTRRPSGNRGGEQEEWRLLPVVTSRFGHAVGTLRKSVKGNALLACALIRVSSGGRDRHRSGDLALFSCLWTD